MVGTDTTQSTNILYSIFKPVSDLSNYPLWFLFLLLGGVSVIATMIFVMKHTQNQLFAGAAGLVITFAFYKIGVFDWWMFFLVLLMFIGLVVMERKPTL
jgi:hypothetical protein